MDREQHWNIGTAALGQMAGGELLQATQPVLRRLRGAGGAEAQDGGGPRVPVAASHCCTAEISTAWKAIVSQLKINS